MGALNFTHALEQAELLARQALPPEVHERLSCATALVRQGSVFQDDTGHWTVASATTEGKRYSVNGSCSCEDAFYRAPEGRCKHKLAQLLARKVQALMTVTQDAQEPAEVPSSMQGPEVCGNVHTPQPLPEAPASVNVRVTISGYEVQWTLRDADEGRLAERLAQLLARYPKPVAQQARQPIARGKEWCSLHNVAMRWNEGKEGRKGWWSHRLPDDQGWCKGREGGAR